MTDTSAFFNEAEYHRHEAGFSRRLEEAFRDEEFLSFEPPPEWAFGYAEMRDLLSQNIAPQKRWIKLQITGPGTVWRSFFSEQIKGSLTIPMRAHLRQLLTASGLAQIQRVRLHDRNPLLVIDDPFFLEDPKGLQDMVSVFKRRGAKAGLHLCSSFIPWDKLRELGLDLFHFDEKYLSGSSSETLFLDQFLKQGKWVAWGIIPTSSSERFPTKDFSSLLLDRIKSLQRLGWPLEEILRHSLLAPACGTGTLTPEAHGEVTGSLLATAEGLKNSYFLS